jgi:integrase
MTISRTCCKTTFPFDQPLCPRCGLPAPKLKVRVKTPAQGWKTMVTEDLRTAEAFEAFAKSDVDETTRERASARYMARASAKARAAQEKAEAEAAEEARLRGSASPRLSEVFKKYLEVASKTKRSWQSDRSLYNRYLSPILGHLPLELITPEKVEECLDSLKRNSKFINRTEESLAPATKRQAFGLLRHLFNYARRRRLWRGENPTAFLEPIKVSNERQRYFSEEEVKSLLDSIEAYSTSSENPQQRIAGFLIQFLLLSGRRRGECLLLEEKDVDHEHSTVTFRFTKSGKTQVVPISGQALALIHQALSARPARHGGKVFPFRSVHSFNACWKRVRARAGLKDAKLHDLRHTFASAAVSNGVELYTVSQLLGHVELQTTQRYSHLSPGAQRDAVNKVSQLFKHKPRPAPKVEVEY